MARSIGVKTPKLTVKTPAASNGPKAPGLSSGKTPNVGSGLKGYLAAAKILKQPSPQKNGLGSVNQS